MKCSLEMLCLSPSRRFSSWRRILNFCQIALKSLSLWEIFSYARSCATRWVWSALHSKLLKRECQSKWCWCYLGISRVWSDLPEERSVRMSQEKEYEVDICAKEIRGRRDLGRKIVCSLWVLISADQTYKRRNKRLTHGVEQSLSMGTRLDFS